MSFTDASQGAPAAKTITRRVQRFPKGKRAPKNDGTKSQLIVQWGKDGKEAPALQYYWRLSDADYADPAHRPIKRDINVLMHMFENVRWPEDKTLAEELTQRGWDITTFKFTIEKLKEEPL